MGREVRMVPSDWEHPKEWNVYRKEECYKPLLSSPYTEAFHSWREEELPEWLEGYDKWQEGLCTDYKGGWEPIEEKYRAMTYEEYADTCPASPDPKDYMPDWPDKKCTHFMMYEDTSEGTPISPAFATAEELAKWLADTGASAFADQTATYEQWLSTINRGSAVSAVLSGAGFQSGVAAEHTMEDKSHD